MIVQQDITGKGFSETFSKYLDKVLKWLKIFWSITGQRTDMSATIRQCKSCEVSHTTNHQWADMHGDSAMIAFAFDSLQHHNDMRTHLNDRR